MQSVVKEQQFQRTGLTEDNAAAFGKLLNVPGRVGVADSGKHDRIAAGPADGKIAASAGAAMSALPGER